MILQIEQLETLGIWEVGASLEVGMGNGVKALPKQWIGLVAYCWTPNLWDGFICKDQWKTLTTFALYGYTLKWQLVTIEAPYNC